MFSRLLGLNTWLQRSCGIKGVNFIDNFNIFWGYRQLFKLDGLHLNKLGVRVLKDNIFFSLHHPSVMFANQLCLNGTHKSGESISYHRTSFQLQSHHVAHTSHKDTDNTMQSKQPLLMDIPAEPCPQSSSHTDCDVLQQLQDSATKDNFLENSQGSQDNISQPPDTPETETRSSDTLPLSPTSPLLRFSQKMEELMFAGTKLSHFFAANPKISTKKWQAPPTTKNSRPSSPSSSCESSPTAATMPGPKPSSVICVGSLLYWQQHSQMFTEQAGTQRACSLLYFCLIT